MTETRRPNFLFLISDQQRADWLGCYGHPVLHTPNIDSIAAKGSRFENFNVALPVCMPNRASLLTGRYPSVHGLRHNGCRLPVNANTFVHTLADAGYHTAAIGKSHLQPFTGLPPRRAVDDSVGEAWLDQTDDHGHEEPDRYQTSGKYEFPTPYYGYQHVDMVTSHGDRCGGHYLQWFRENAPDWEALHDPAIELPHTYTCPQAYRTPVPEALYPTSFIRDKAVDYLEGRKDKENPFFAFVSFPDPHHPFNPPGKYWDMYDPDQFSVDLPYSAHKNPTPSMKWLHENWKSGGGQLNAQTAMMLEDQQIKEAMALTAGMMSMIDDAVGDILKALDRSGQRDNTIIVYNSDHGDYLGDFNMMLKGPLPFRSINQVPFIWSEPGQQDAKTVSTLSSTVDIAPTILARAGLAQFNGIQGHSLLPAIQGTGREELREDLLIEYNDGGPRITFDPAARIRSLVSHKWRYTFYAGESWGELYDLESDPNECENLWDNPAFRNKRGELAERLNYHLTRQMDESPAADRLA